jgi:hypothetical protein
MYDFSTLDLTQASQVSNILGNITSLQRLCIEDYFDYEYTLALGPTFLSELYITLQGFYIDQARLISSYCQLTKLVLSSPSVNTRRSFDEHFILHSLLFLSSDDLSILQHFTTPSLAELDIQPSLYNTDDEDMECNGILLEFLERCTSGVQSFTLDSDVGDAFVAYTLPLLFVQPTLQQLSIPLWPLGMESKLLSGSRERPWCPNLRDMTVSMQEDDEGGPQQMEELARFLQSREEMDVKRIERLTVHKPSDMGDFPYETFRDVPVDKLCVMVSL